MFPLRTSFFVGRIFSLVIGGGLACGGSACETYLAPIDVAAGCPDGPAGGPTDVSGRDDRLIDDFESGDEKLPWLGGRNGSWVKGATNPEASIVAAASSPQCAERGRRAGHFVGTLQWGWANWTAIFHPTARSASPPYDVAQGYDASAYSAISFWAAAGTTAAEPLEVPVGLTTLDIAWNGKCYDAECSDAETSCRCMDAYKKTVPLTRTWQHFVVPFAGLAQSGWGRQLPLRRDELVGFIVWPNQEFDVWIDDLRFEP